MENQTENKPKIGIRILGTVAWPDCGAVQTRQLGT